MTNIFVTNFYFEPVANFFVTTDLLVLSVVLPLRSLGLTPQNPHKNLNLKTIPDFKALSDSKVKKKLGLYQDLGKKFTIVQPKKLITFEVWIWKASWVCDSMSLHTRILCQWCKS